MSNVIKLDVGGSLYKTTKDTLTKYQDSMLASMFSGRHPMQPDKNGYHFIDRDGKIFEYILKFLRDDNINLDDVPKNIIKNIMDEAEYYNIQPLLTFLEKEKHISREEDIYGAEYVLQKIFSMYNVNVEEFERKLKETYTIDNFIKTHNGKQFVKDHFEIIWRKNVTINGYDFYNFVDTIGNYAHLYFNYNSSKGSFKPFKSIKIKDVLGGIGSGTLYMSFNI